MKPRTCVVCGSDEKVWRFKGKELFCRTHYNEMYNHGEIRNLNGKRKKMKNVFVIKDDCIEIHFKKGQVGLIDKDDFAKVEKEYWGLNSQGYVHARIDGKLTRLQRYLLNFPEDIVDHKNGNKLDNRKENLRICTHKENSKNLSRKSNNRSGYPGVSIIKTSGKWRARIMVDRKEINLGHFDLFLDAVEARVLAELKYYGDFAPSLREVAI